MAENITITTDGDTVTIKAKLSAGVLSSSGKSLVVASTGGFVPVPNSNLKVNLNITKPR